MLQRMPASDVHLTRGPGAARIGIGGPVGSGKTALIERLIPVLGARGVDLAVVTNALVTKEDAERLRRSGLIDPARVSAVEAGACPHTVIREDPTLNIAAGDELEDRSGRTREVDQSRVPAGRPFAAGEDRGERMALRAGDRDKVAAFALRQLALRVDRRRGDERKRRCAKETEVSHHTLRLRMSATE